MWLQVVLFPNVPLEDKLSQEIYRAYYAAGASRHEKKAAVFGYALWGAL